MELRDLDLNLLLVLDALYEEATLTRTAQRLRLSQPTVSAALAKLRQVLGDELFVRSGGVMQPTARAQALQPVVSSVLNTIRTELLAQAGFEPASAGGAFTLSLSDIGELEFLPRLLRRISAEAPNLEIRSVVATPADLATAMDLGEIDLAAGYFPDLNTSVFKQQLLFRHRSACIVRRNHPAIGADMTLDDFLAARHVAVAQQGRVRDVVELGLAAQGLRRQIGLQTSHFVSVPFLVAASDLIGTIPRPLALQFAAVCDLLVIEPPFPIPPIEVKQVWHRRFDAQPRLRWIRQIVAETSQNRPSLGAEPTNEIDGIAGRSHHH
jgi:DNA-binding transcriptional LysR family regulator